jgi:hypothetical protein
MPQNKSLFFGIIALAIVAVIGMAVVVYFFADSLNLSTGQPQTTIEIVAPAALEPWVAQAALEFNRQNRAAQVTVSVVDGLLPENRFPPADPQANAPAAWIAPALFLAELAKNQGQAFAAESQSVAGTSLAWGAYADKEATLTEKYGPLGWDSLHAKAAAPGDFLTLVIASPTNSAEGLGALISATAAHLGKETLTGADVRQAMSWLTKTLADNSRTPPKPAESFATAQGRSIGDAGLLSMASWRQSGLHQKNDFLITSATPPVRLDYPFLIWQGRGATDNGQQAAAAFRDFLLMPAQQNKLANYYFDPATPDTTGTVQADGDAALALLRWAERELR